MFSNVKYNESLLYRSVIKRNIVQPLSIHVTDFNKFLCSVCRHPRQNLFIDNPINLPQHIVPYISSSDSSERFSHRRCETKTIPKRRKSYAADGKVVYKSGIAFSREIILFLKHKLKKHR